MMTINKIRRCKRMIASSGYYRDRAIQMGEMYGAWVAEMITSTGKDELCQKMSHRYFNKLVWYTNKAKGTNWNESMDYDT